MKLYAHVKQAGSRKNYITNEEIILDSAPSSLRALIEDIVTKNVNDFNMKLKKEKLVEYLTNEDINNKLVAGKVSFGEIHNRTEENLKKAIEVALLAYEDGIYRVFIGDKEAGGLDDALEIKDGEVITFIKLTMLAGRMW